MAVERHAEVVAPSSANDNAIIISVIFWQDPALVLGGLKATGMGLVGRLPVMLGRAGAAAISRAGVPA